MKGKYVKQRQHNGAYNKQRRHSPTKHQIKNRNIHLLKDLSLAIVFSLLILIAITMYYFQFISMTGLAMSPTLKEEDKVIISKKSSWQRFDLLAIKNPGKPIQIRRLIGSPGEKILYREDLLYINDEVVDENFLVSEINSSQASGKNYTENLSSMLLNKDGVIPDKFYLVLGDNRPYATDSRHYGLVPQKNIMGKVVARYWPINEFVLF
ncbi:signal peptidase I [Enterococcus rivorum]|uniref:Signal peptidase I n=1 Tax=Enterococcus rivorum TaxID=762845 RepID=A0A1E5KUM4_9ENTE|nr:signal peptidase I [Enterococcus rivorum]MBP2100543.1 signal peptidase I [Enterococcus rivorum]OEH81587.1 signal peptidase I [Enterococcus rivorum]